MQSTLLRHAVCRVLFGALLAWWMLAAAAAAVLPGPVVSAQWLKEHMREVQVVDVREDLNTLTDDPKYRTEGGKKVLVRVGGHIPEALSVNFWGLREKRDVQGKTIDFLLPSAESFQQRMQGVQLQPGKPIVIAATGDDASSMQEAALFAWELQVFGVPADQIAILDGGTHAWIAAGYPIDTDAIAPMTPSQWSAKQPDARLLASTAQVQAAIRARQPLLDARPLAQFAGLETSPVAPHPGRLPGSVPVASEIQLREADDGSWRFLDARDYRAILTAARWTPPRHASIIYCNTGQYAAAAWFILDRIMGLRGLKVYQGSMNEWQALGLPVIWP